MRILQIIQRPQLRGVEISTCQLSEELTKQGAHVDILYLFGSDSAILDYDLNFIALRAKQKRRLWDIRSYRALNLLIRRGEYDIVQANAADTLKYAALSKLIYRWKALLIYRNASLIGRLINTWYQRLYNKLLLNSCDLIISVSEHCRQDLFRLFPESKGRAITIPNGTLSFDAIAPIKKEFANDEPVFIHVGSFVWEKNHEFLIALFELYFLRNSKGYLWLVGDGKLKPSIEEKVKKMKLESRIVFWGARKDVIPILKAADLLIMPSVVEGVPGVILEALSCGIPVIASNAGGIPDVVQHNVNGFCMENFNENEYVKHMEELTTNISLRQQFIQAGKTLVEASFVMPVVAQRFLNIYSKVLKKKLTTSLAE